MRDSTVEKHLDDRLVKWRYVENVPLSQVDERNSLRNQARFEPLHEDVVARYTEAMERGDEFPALVGAQKKDGDYILTDGNHRYQAKKRSKAESVDIYVVTGSPEVLQLLTFEANARHGMPPSIDERMRHAIYLIDNGASHESAAASTGLQKSQVTSAWASERADRRARSLGVTRGWAKLTKSQRERLAGISTDAGFVEATKLVVDTRMSTLDTQRLANAMKPLRSDKAQIEAVEMMREQLREMKSSESGPVTSVMNARRLLIPHVAYIVSADIEAIVNSTITNAQAEDIIRRLKDAGAAIDLMVEALGKRYAEES